MRFQSRIVVAAAVVATLFAAACTSGASKNSNSGGAGNGSSLTKVRVMMFPGQSYRLPVQIADQQGYFKNHGIQIEVVAQPNNLQGAQAMLATKSQVGQLSTPTLAQGVENGSPVSFFCGGINVLQTTLIAKKGSALPATADGASWQDVLKSLSGKKVGVQTPIGSGLQLLFAAALKEAGVTNVTYVNVGGGNNITLAALNNGSVDVAQVNPNGTQQIAIDGSAKPLLYVSQGPEAYKLYGSGWTGQTSWLKEQPKVAAGFCQAVGEALAFIKNPTNAGTAAKTLAADTGVSAAVAALVVKQVYADYSTDLPKDVLTRTFASYKTFGIVKTDLAAEYDKLVQTQQP
jgi:NitT/TauT family transport system substrate-binding protein